MHCVIHQSMFDRIWDSNNRLKRSRDDRGDYDTKDLENQIRSHPRSFTVDYGGSGSKQSILTTYRLLWEDIYGENTGVCSLDENIEGCVRVHRASNVPTYPWLEQRYVRDNAFGDIDAITNVATSSVPESDFTRVQWLCDVRTRIESHTNVVKLMDYKFECAAEAWTLISQIVDWCCETYETIGMFPIRRSVWDMLMMKKCQDITESWTRGMCNVGNDSWYRVASCCGLTDIGFEMEYARTLKKLLLIVYVCCCYGGIGRKTTANERVSNHTHVCSFPPKTSGIYRALFHTSILPHRLTCYEIESSSDWLNHFHELAKSCCRRYNVVPPRRTK